MRDMFLLSSTACFLPTYASTHIYAERERACTSVLFSLEDFLDEFFRHVGNFTPGIESGHILGARPWPPLFPYMTLLDFISLLYE